MQSEPVPTIHQDKAQPGQRADPVVGVATEVAPDTVEGGIGLVDTADIGLVVKGIAVAAAVVDTAPAGQGTAAVDTGPGLVEDTVLALTGEGIVPAVDIAGVEPAAQAGEPDSDPERIPVRFRQPPESLLQSTTPSFFVYASLSPFLQCSLA